MDLNSDINRHTSQICQLINKCDLKYPMKSMNPSLEYIPTCKTESTRIDIILTTQAILPSINNIHYLEYDEITNTDHRPILLDLNTKTLFQNKYLSRFIVEDA